MESINQRKINSSDIKNETFDMINFKNTKEELLCKIKEEMK